MFFNTTNENGSLLKQYEKQALSQEQIITQFFIVNKGKKLSPFDVQHSLFLHGAPITSIRRAITNLTDEGVLRKTTTRKKGPYGHNCYCWELANK